MQDLDLHRRLVAARQSRGNEARTLVWGDEALEIAGLDAGLARELELRWGAFLRHPSPPTAQTKLEIRDGGAGEWLVSAAGPELYRLEAINDPRRRVIASHNYGLAMDEPSGSWRLAVREDSPEPLQRIVDNAARFLVATRAVRLGGFAMHSSAVLRAGRAYVFAGPSGSGKTTAVGLTRPAKSLGDDFGVVLPGVHGWVAPALPFDNTERVEGTPPPGLHPVAGIWKLLQASAARVDEPNPTLAVASLMSCVAFPWAMPEAGGELLEHVGRFVAGGLFRHLHFTKKTPIWDYLG